MRTRTRRRAEEEVPSFDFEDESVLNVDLESLSDEELETLLFEEQEEKNSGIWNLPTMAGLSLILVGIAYILQEMNVWQGFPNMADIVAMLPWLAGILIILLGFGVLSWRPKKRKPVKKVKVDLKAEKPKLTVEKEPRSHSRKLRKSKDKKVAGVAAGIAEYFNIDPTLVRIAFVVGTIATSGSFFFAYLILAMVMPKSETLTREERITIIRDS